MTQEDDVRDPNQCRFAKSHEWLSPDGTVGISEHAQKEITDVVFVELPKVGKVVQAGEAVAVVESVKAAFDIYAPVAGKISKVNTALSKTPALINQSPYENGWIFLIEKSNPSEESQLMAHQDYQTFLESDTH
jgi:glycine cleavage system H protein